MPPKVHRVVVVEDNLDQVHTLAFMLKEMGHSVDFAINGYVAYDVIRRFRPDTVILDLGLPGSTGFEVLSQIKRDPELGEIRVVALTGYGDARYKERAQHAGFDAFYTKPMAFQELEELFGGSKQEFAP
jgi:CheY-like chemotaxis protein